MAAPAITLTLGQLGLLALQQGDLGEARELLCAALTSVFSPEFDRPSNIRYATDGLGGLAALAAHDGHHTLAGRLWGAVESLETQLGPQIMHDDRSYFEQTLAELSGPDYEAALAAGRTLTLHQAINEALHAFASGQLARARPAERVPS
jgi:hypothetical protein